MEILWTLSPLRVRVSLQALPSKSQPGLGSDLAGESGYTCFSLGKTVGLVRVEGDVPASLLSGSYKASKTPQKLLVFTASASVIAPSSLDGISSFL